MKDEELDLHRVRHGEVRGIVDKFIYRHLQKGTSRVIIITGNSAHMKELVKEALDDYGMFPEEDWMNHGQLNISLR